LLFAAASSRAETLDQFYEKAKLEKTLVFYSGGPAAPHENRAKEFMQKYPGIAVSVTGGFSNVLNERIERQIADRKPEVDMAFFQTVQDFVTWKTQGKLLAFKPDQILPNFRDEDGAYLALSATRLLMPTIPPGSARRMRRNRRRIFSSRCLRAR
jgi:ABC-type glycerol-3-phosphate transport system substrate-binding protein